MRALVGVERRAEQEALHLVAALRLQEDVLLRRLDPFGHDDEPHAAPHGDDRARDRRVVGALRQPGDERAVDLQRVDREALEVRER